MAQGRLRRIAEEEYILVVLLAGFGLIFLLIFPPALVVNDSWLNLMAGREVVENGLPTETRSRCTASGRPGPTSSGSRRSSCTASTASAASRSCRSRPALFVVSAFTIAAAASRSLGAGPRAIWLLFLPVLISAALGWSIRAQMLALPLYTGLLWLLATQARRRRGSSGSLFPLLVLWANMHGSVALGALLVMLLGAYELVRSRGPVRAPQRRSRRPRSARAARHALRARSRPCATTTSSSSIPRSPAR